MDTTDEWEPIGGTKIFDLNGFVGYSFDSKAARNQAREDSQSHGYHHARIFWHRDRTKGKLFLQLSRIPDLESDVLYPENSQFSPEAEDAPLNEMRAFLGTARDARAEMGKPFLRPLWEAAWIQYRCLSDREGHGYFEPVPGVEAIVRPHMP